MLTVFLQAPRSACAADVQHPDRGAEQETVRHDEQVEQHDPVDPEDLLQAARPACARARVEDSSATLPGTHIETGSDTMVGEAAEALSPGRDEVSEDNEETVLRKVAVLGSGAEAEEVQDMQAIERGPTIEQHTATVGADASDEDPGSSVLDAPEVHQPLTDMLASATAQCDVQAQDSCTLPDATDVIPLEESERASEQAEQAEQVEQAEALLDKRKRKTDDFDFGGCVEADIGFWACWLGMVRLKTLQATRLATGKALVGLLLGQSKILAADESSAMQRRDCLERALLCSHTRSLLQVFSGNFMRPARRGRSRLLTRRRRRLQSDVVEGNFVILGVQGLA